MIGKENHREDPSFCPRSLLYCHLLPACLLLVIALRILPRKRPKPEQITASRNRKAESQCSLLRTAPISLGLQVEMPPPGAHGAWPAQSFDDSAHNLRTSVLKGPTEFRKLDGKSRRLGGSQT